MVKKKSGQVGKRFSVGKINVNFSNRLLYTLIAFFGVLLLGAGVYAFTGKPNPGHDFTEMAKCDSGDQIVKMVSGTWACRKDGVGNIETCGDGQILKMSGSSWSCASDATGGGGGESVWSGSGDIYYTGGKVGVGTSNFDSSSGSLNVHRSDDLLTAIKVSNPQLAVVNFQAVNSGKNWYLSSSSGGIGFSEDSPITTSKLAIANGGNVGIGTDGPSEKLHVVGNLKVTGEITYGSLATKPVPGPQFAGVTSNSYTGGQIGGYSQGDSKCSSAISGSRMATAEDFSNGLTISGVTGSAWYSRYTKWTFELDNPSAYNDCDGWTSNTATEKGYYWSSSSGISTANCNNLNAPILCVK